MENLNNLTEKEIEILKNSICADLTEAELNLFISVCNRTGLNPLTRQIYAIVTSPNDPKWRKFMTLVSIDGFRIIAERSGRYLGQTAAEWCGDDGVWKEVWVSNKYPTAARIGILISGNPIPLYVTAHWSESAKLTGKGTGTWEKMPCLMLAKCAEALALRKAFPQDMSGLYSPEEIDISENKPQTFDVKKPNQIASAPLISVEKFTEMISACETIEAVKSIALMIPKNVANWGDVNSPYLAVVNAKKATFEVKPKDEITTACESALNCKTLDELDDAYANLYPSISENAAVINAFEARRTALIELDKLPY